MIRKIHLSSAILLLLYGLAHLTNHLWAYEGIEAHQHLLEQFRLVYRNPLIETLLIMSCLGQAITGCILLRKSRGGALSFWDKLQRYSGLILLVFLTLHPMAVFWGRWISEVDTNFYFAAAVLLSSSVSWFFFPYYGLGVVAFFIHLGTGLRWHLPPQHRNTLAAICLGFGVVVAGLILFVFSGAYYPIELPAEYARYPSL